MVYVQNATKNPRVILQNYCKRVRVMRLTGAGCRFQVSARRLTA
jgi:hypothetical protein